MRRFVVWVLVCLSACDRVVEVAPHKVPCVGLDAQWCLLVDGDFFYDDIEGFSFAWGESAELRVRVSPVIAPLQDGSSVRYRLLTERVRELQEPSERFSALLFDRGLVETRSDGGWSLSDGTALTFETPGLEEGFRQALEVTPPCLTLELGYPARQGGALQVFSMEPGSGAFGC